MSLISGVHDGRRILFDVAVVGVSLNATTRFPDDEPSISVFGDPVRALVDTGATSTSISPEAVQRLGLQSIGKRDIMTANGPRRARAYNFRVALVGNSPGASPFYILPRAIIGAELNSEKFAFDILLGMDVISQGDLTIRRNGTFTFEF